jgi:hypothetical protein
MPEYDLRIWKRLSDFPQHRQRQNQIPERAAAENKYLGDRIYTAA